ncbi:hypothetical protein AOLI_G00127710 [Acnodon oligacanthus]
MERKALCIVHKKVQEVHVNTGLPAFSAGQLNSPFRRDGTSLTFGVKGGNWLRSGSLEFSLRHHRRTNTDRRTHMANNMRPGTTQMWKPLST